MRTALAIVTMLAGIAGPACILFGRSHLVGRVGGLLITAAIAGIVGSLCVDCL